MSSVLSTRFIGLDGGQGSGKSTYAQKLTVELHASYDGEVAYIETDDFLTEREWRERLPISFFKEFSNYRQLWDFGHFGKVIKQLRESKGEPIVVDGLYNRATGRRDRQTIWKVNPGDTVLVGGPYLLESEVEGLLERKIFLDVPIEERLKRVIGRNAMLGKSEARAREVFEKFENFFIPYWANRMDQYDEIVDNGG